MELPKDKRPPRSIWSSPSKLERWFDQIFKYDKPERPIYIGLDEVED